MTQNTMKIARFRGFQKGLVLEEAEKPLIADNEVLIRTGCCAVSGTDIYRYREKKDPVIPPFADGETPGHEIAGTVEDAGSRVTRCKPGDRVVVQPFWGGVNTAWRASIAAAMGDLDQAVRLLDHAIDEGWYVRLNPHRSQFLKPLRGFPSFERLVEPKG